MILKHLNLSHKILLLLLFLSIILSVYVLVNTQSVKDKYQKNEEHLGLQIDSLNQELKLFESILEADNAFFENQFESAHSKYIALQQSVNLSPSLVDMLQIRIKKLENLNDANDESNTLLNQYKYDLKSLTQAKVNAEEAYDSLLIVFEESLQKKQNALLQTQKELNAKNEQLALKDKLQVLSFRSESGNLIHYLGEVKEGKANGGGVGIWDTGGIYKGDWKDNKRHGQGNYKWKDGHVYEGTFVNDTRDGNGTYIWSSGEKYVGEWKNNKRNGKGVLYDKDNNIQFEGEWLNDKLK
jgi:hypothetical protein